MGKFKAARPVEIGSIRSGSSRLTLEAFWHDQEWLAGAFLPAESRRLEHHLGQKDLVDDLPLVFVDVRAVRGVRRGAEGRVEQLAPNSVLGCSDRPQGPS
jgi:hypothetical protein